MRGDSVEPDRQTGMIPFLAHFLIVLAGWTITIKYLFPLGYALAHGEPIGSHIYWDFWPLAHLWLAWALLNRQRYTNLLAVGMSVVEIAIIVTKFALFLSAPEWTLWTTNWFINKIFVLLCFSLILATFAREWQSYSRGKRRRARRTV